MAGEHILRESPVTSWSSKAHLAIKKTSQPARGGARTGSGKRGCSLRPDLRPNAFTYVPAGDQVPPEHEPPRLPDRRLRRVAGPRVAASPCADQDVEGAITICSRQRLAEYLPKRPPGHLAGSASANSPPTRPRFTAITSPIRRVIRRANPTTRSSWAESGLTL